MSPDAAKDKGEIRLLFGWQVTCARATLNRAWLTPCMTEPESPGLTRALGLWDVTTITAGTILGSAIFVAAAFVPREVPHPRWCCSLWVAGG